MQCEEVRERIRGLDDKPAKAVVCALVGHSRIVTTCFGYIHCARCEAQIGDSLGGSSTTKENVIVGHDCEVCRKNFALCDWHDTFMAPDPFDPEKVAEMRRGAAALEEFKKSRGLG